MVLLLLFIYLLHIVYGDRRQRYGINVKINRIQLKKGLTLTVNVFTPFIVHQNVISSVEDGMRENNVTH